MVGALSILRREAQHHIGGVSVPTTTGMKKCCLKQIATAAASEFTLFTSSAMDAMLCYRGSFPYGNGNRRRQVSSISMSLFCLSVRMLSVYTHALPNSIFGRSGLSDSAAARRLIALWMQNCSIESGVMDSVDCTALCTLLISVVIGLLDFIGLCRLGYVPGVIPFECIALFCVNMGVDGLFQFIIGFIYSIALQTLYSVLRNVFLFCIDFSVSVLTIYGNVTYLQNRDEGRCAFINGSVDVVTYYVTGRCFLFLFLALFNSVDYAAYLQSIYDFALPITDGVDEDLSAPVLRKRVYLPTVDFMPLMFSNMVGKPRRGTCGVPSNKQMHAYNGNSASSTSVSLEEKDITDIKVEKPEPVVTTTSTTATVTSTTSPVVPPTISSVVPPTISSVVPPTISSVDPPTPTMTYPSAKPLSYRLCDVVECTLFRMTNMCKCPTKVNK